jgi:eukaryotic-like serine/threonine-protein kinase
MQAMTATAYSPGYLIAGKYELESLIGEGGMGTVWRARNVALDSPVAIKVVRATGDGAMLRERLLQEARAAAKLAHAAIVKVFDVGQTESGDPFIVMELLQGTSFGNVLERDGRLPAVQAVRLLLPIVDALWLAHEKGIVHRDLKPDNVFIVQQEGAIQPTLVDFGIVKIEEGESTHHLTRAGDVLGSPEYMSPEQARGLDAINHLTDMWSFSVVLYETITGETPFHGSNYNALLRQIVEVTPPTLLELSMADAELSAIVARGMSKAPEKRYGSMGELGRALAAWLFELGFSEDICGTSLEAKWLRVAETQTRAGRASLASFADWPVEAGSGVRRNVLSPIVTVRAPPDTTRVVSTSPPANARRSRPSWVWGIAGAVVLLAGLAWAAMRGPGGEPRALAAPAPRVFSAAPLPAKVSPVAARAETAQPAAEAVSSAKGRRPSVNSPGPKPAPKPTTTRAPDKAPRSSAPGDLLSPY